MDAASVTQRFYEAAWNTGDLQAARRLLAPDLVDHDPVAFPGRLDGADGLISEVDKRYDHELERLAELETRKREAAEERERREMAAIEERRNAYANLIADQQRREIEAGERVAKAISEATSRAFSEMTKSLTLDRLVTTMEALNANMEKLTRQRFAMG